MLHTTDRGNFNARPCTWKTAENRKPGKTWLNTVQFKTGATNSKLCGDSKEPTAHCVTCYVLCVVHWTQVLSKLTPLIVALITHNQQMWCLEKKVIFRLVIHGKIFALGHYPVRNCCICSGLCLSRDMITRLPPEIWKMGRLYKMGCYL